MTFDVGLCCIDRPVKPELPAVLNNRSNVFDDDEFDVLRRDRVDMSRVWKGRRYSRIDALCDAAL